MATAKSGSRPEDERLSLQLLMRQSWERPTTRDWQNVLRALPLFSHLSTRHLRQVAKLAKFVEFAPGDFIVNVGEPGDAFYLIVSGKAKVVGKPRARALGSGDFFGEMALIDGEPRSATITATTELHAMMLARRPFLKVLEQGPRLALTLMAELAARIRRLERSV
jgi:CRP/FNR family transcriptional regulator/CRP/FNR family cyclic AMP-dependent transcriptional regulator